MTENYSDLLKKGFNVLGISPDSVTSHLKFIAKFNLAFDLIADVDKSICLSYGVFGKKKFMGREYEGVYRTTFIINENQIIEKVFTKVNTKNHTEQILESYKKMIMSKELDAKQKALALTMEKIDKTYGKGTIMKLGDAPIIDVEAISTGSIGIDLALGVGGLPKGRVVEIFGPESSGKTTLTLHAIAEAQKRGGIAAFIDAEHAFDRFYAKKLGVDIDNLLISQPDCGEQALEIADNLIRSAAIDILVIDSVAALTPKSEIEGEMGDSKLGLQARLMSQALRKMTATISKSGCICVFINQLREKIGVMFGNPETTTGGNALSFIRQLGLILEEVLRLRMVTRLLEIERE